MDNTAGDYQLERTPKGEGEQQLVRDAEKNAVEANNVALSVQKLETAAEGERNGSSTTQGTEKEKEVPAGPVATYRDLFRFASTLDWVLIGLGVFCSVVGGAALPLFAILFGDAINAFVPSYDEDKVIELCLLLLALAVGLFIFDYLSYAFFTQAAERQMREMRRQCLDAILKQEMGWFDVKEPSTLASRIAGDTVVIQEGIGEKLSDLIRFAAGFFSGFIIGFIKGWLLAIVMCAAVPVLSASIGILFKKIQTLAIEGQRAYARAGGVAEETFSSIRTVASFTAEAKALSKYERLVLEAEKVLLRGSVTQGLGVGATMFTVFCTYSLGMWYGGKLVSEQNSVVNTPGQVFSVFFAIMLGTVSLGQASPNISALAQAKGTFGGIMEILDRQPEIQKEEGISPASCEGKIDFQDISFRYPSRPAVQILNGFNLNINPGETVALVGGSGGGKSTVVSLLERFYDVEGGVILLDGRDLRSLSPQWVRQQIGLVGQEPVLFDCSIRENIRYGRPGATDEDVEAAAKSSNAHNFIMSFPLGYDTPAGEKGVQLSGGQKQRIAIARAIVRDPAILLLDEATSALDRESERMVQAALDNLLSLKKRTTIIIAHRLSTIKGSDQIAVVMNGKVVEKGTHDALMSIPNGAYSELVRLQEGEKTEDEEDAVVDDATPSQKDLKKIQSESMLSRSGPFSSTLKQSFHSEIKRGDDDEDMEKAAQVEEELKSFNINRIWKLNRPERPYVIVSLLSAVINGFAQPLIALLLTEVLRAFQDYRGDKLYDEISLYALFFLLIGVLMLITFTVQTYGFAVMGEKLTSRLRVNAFSAMLAQDIGWFDRSENNTGALSSRLATDAAQVKLITGENQGRVLQLVFCLLASLILAFALGNWKLSLIMTALLPLIVVSTMLQMGIAKKSMGEARKSLDSAGKLATEAISNVRTVAAFGLENVLVRRYDSVLEGPMKDGIKKGHISGFSIGFAQLVNYGGFALIFYIGGTYIRDQEADFNEMMKSLMIIMMGAAGIGRTAAFMGDTVGAKASALSIFRVMDRKSPINPFDEQGRKLDKVEGKIDVKNVYFRYPARPEVPILRNYNLHVEAGETVALVGRSGSGKSTVLSLLERFYDPDSGCVLLDGVDVRELNIQWLRHQIGLVSQEPILFSGTILENILYGNPKASREEAEEAAKKANAYTFISSFPSGFDTPVGDKGLQLSGGQKQRIAIARAIIKDPAILMLDEATSALDSHSEKVVQAALDQLMLMRKRTTLVIAHRLSTIIGADSIAFVHNGKVIEKGTHKELLAKRGHYARLYEEREKEGEE